MVGVELQAGRAFVHLGQGFGQRLTHLSGHQQRQLGVALTQHGGRGPQHLAADLEIFSRPDSLRGRRNVESGVDLLRGHRRVARELLTGGGIDGHDRLTSKFL